MRFVPLDPDNRSFSGLVYIIESMTLLTVNNLGTVHEQGAFLFLHEVGEVAKLRMLKTVTLFNPILFSFSLYFDPYRCFKRSARIPAFPLAGLAFQPHVRFLSTDAVSEAAIVQNRIGVERQHDALQLFHQNLIWSQDLHVKLVIIRLVLGQVQVLSKPVVVSWNPRL